MNKEELQRRTKRFGVKPPRTEVRGSLPEAEITPRDFSSPVFRPGISARGLNVIIEEANELTAIFASTVKTARQKQKIPRNSQSTITP